VPFLLRTGKWTARSAQRVSCCGPRRRSTPWLAGPEGWLLGQTATDEK
jgi:hypothetical protein